MARACSADLIVLDFDGTLTDADAHAPEFFEASREEVARRLGWDEPTSRSSWQEALDRVRSLPADAAWIVNDRGVCPAAVDPYMIANSAALGLFAAHRPGLDPRELIAEVLAVHQAAYQRAPSPYRAEAREVIEALCASGAHVRVVSNSNTDTVARRLDGLGLASRARVGVRGDAAKFSVSTPRTPDARFDALPETADWWEGGRPILLRRGRYFDALRSIWDETATTPETTLVAGDVFELDLAMPAALGAHVHLVTRAGTMPHERGLAEAQPRGGSSAGLSGVLERLMPRH